VAFLISKVRSVINPLAAGCMTKIWGHLYSSSAGGKSLSNDTLIGVFGLIESDICSKMLRNLSVKL